VGRIQREGALGGVLLEDVSEVRRGQRFAFVMDTRVCDGVLALAEGADLLVIESTFLTEDADLALRYGHLTARQAGTVAAESGVRRLVLTHFSQRYEDPERFRAEAAEVFGGEIVVASDLDRVGVPRRDSTHEDEASTNRRDG
jgi:ribonuclease Z